jgi:hypothetical protein
LRVELHHSLQQVLDTLAYQASAVYAVFEEMLTQTRSALEDGEFEFAALLPGDDTALAERAASFASWCRGFLSGFGLSGVTDLSSLGEDARGFLRDLERFGALDLSQQSDDEDERALLELTEFARMGVLIVHAEACVEHADPPPYYH